MSTVPDFATHYYPEEDQPFQNLSDLNRTSQIAMIEKLAQRRSSDSGYRRVFGPRYIGMRLKTEAKIRNLFLAAGGKPERQAPHYFVLGTSVWFENLYPNTSSVTVPLDVFPHHVTSVTYPDSFAAMRLGEEFGLVPGPLHPAHNKIFPLKDVPQLIQDYGLPEDASRVDYEGYHKQPFEKYIEIQLWSDAPVSDYLK